MNEKFIKARRDYESLLEASMSQPAQSQYGRPGQPQYGHPPGGYAPQGPPAQQGPGRYYPQGPQGQLDSRDSLVLSLIKKKRRLTYTSTSKPTPKRAPSLHLHQPIQRLAATTIPILSQRSSQPYHLGKPTPSTILRPVPPPPNINLR